MIRLVEGLWSEKSRCWLQRVAWNKKTIFLSLQNDVRNGVQFLYYGYRDACMVGCCTVRYEQHADHKEMCVTALAGNFGSVFSMMEFEACLDELAKQNKCSVIRGHIERIGLKKLYEKAGYRVREILNGEWVMVRAICLD